MSSDELILAGKLQLKKLQKKKPEKIQASTGAWTRASQILVGRSKPRRRSLNFFQASFSAISFIAVYLRGSIRHLSRAGLIWFISYIICDKMSSYHMALFVVFVSE